MSQPSKFEWQIGPKRRAITAFLLACCLLAPAMVHAQRACENLTALTLADTTITDAKEVPAGPMKLMKVSILPSPASVDLPEFCKVLGTIKPVPDSEIRFEIWMPVSGWNGRFLQMGNAGFNGPVLPLFLTRGLEEHFAVAGTNNGHQEMGGSFAIGHPEKVTDFAYRAVHLTAERAKDVIKAFYGRSQQHAYFNGCSEGGREALMEAQRYPEDFDGIISGDPGHFWNHLFFAGIWDSRAFQDDPASYLPPAKVELVQKAILSACDELDGVKEGIISDPQRCHFDPGALLCKDDATEACLTAPQVAALKKLYSGPANPRTGERINYGLEPGVNLAAFSIVPGAAKAPNNADFFFRGMVFEDNKWDSRNLNFDEDVRLTDKKLTILDATNPDLTSFRKHGGKLIHYHGWIDPGVPPMTSVAYFESVEVKMGGLKNTTDFYRLFMVPGMNHCFGGPGPNSFGNILTPDPQQPNDENDIQRALVRWVEKGVPPDKIIATKFIDDDSAKGVVMTRVLCPYPQVAKWTGKGDVKSADNFVCRAPEKENESKSRPGR